MKKNTTKVLGEMLETFLQRQSVYGDNVNRIGFVLAALFPDGVKLNTPEDHDRYHLFLMIAVKMTRLAVTNINHQDSAHDLAVYGAMLETAIINYRKEVGSEHS